MTLRKIGFWTALVFLLVSMGQIHEMLPVLKIFKLGALTTFLLYPLILIEIRHLKWSRMLIWRFLVYFSLFPGLFFGYNAGATLKIIKNGFPEMFAFFLGGLLFFRTLEDFKKIETALIALAVALSLWGLTHAGRGPGMLGDENDLAIVLVMLLPFPFFKLFNKMNGRDFTIYLGIFFITLAGIASTISRGGMIGTLVVLGAGWIKSRHKVVAIVLMVLLVTSVVLLSPGGREKTHSSVANGNGTIVSEFTSIGDVHGGTADERIFYWGLSWQMFKSLPLFGVGADSWGSAAWSGLVQTGGRRFTNMTPHSVYFQVLSELGLVGTIAWIGFLISCVLCFLSLTPGRLQKQASIAMAENLNPDFIRQIEARRKFLANFALSLGIGLLGFLASGSFLSVLYYPMLGSFACLMQAAKESWDRDLRLFKIVNQHGNGRAAVPVPAALPPKTALSG